jgi:two-component system, NarL family, response regulator YdfI
MIRVRAIASSAAARRRIEKLIRDSSMQVLQAGDGIGDGLRGDDEADAIVAEFETRFDLRVAEILEDLEGSPLILVVHGPTSDWSDMLSQGARAILPANVSASQLSAAIEAAINGLVVFHANDAEHLILPRGQNEIRDAPMEELTAREVEVLRWMAEGLGNKEIAAKLNISENTAKFHVASIMGKLGATSRTEAVTLGIRRGLVLI